MTIDRPAAKQECPSRVFFLSDCHLGHGRGEAELAREARLVRFLDTLEAGRDGLIIVGDLFDFWFVYRRTIPRAGFPVLSRLDALRRAGVPIDFLAGNHDFWAIPFLRDDLHLKVESGILTRVIQGRRFFIAHGDGMGSGDLGYKLVRPILRSPIAIALYRLIHPDLGIGLASFSSRMSHRASSPDPDIADRAFREVATPAFAKGHEVVVLGHLHVPTLREEAGRALVILGDWRSSPSILRVEGGKLFLEQFDA